MTEDQQATINIDHAKKKGGQLVRSELYLLFLTVWPDSPGFEDVLQHSCE
jgi:hypothetical protein